MQENIEYVVVGDDIAPYYFRVDSVTGEVFVRNGLRTDSFNFDYDVSTAFMLQNMFPFITKYWDNAAKDAGIVNDMSVHFLLELILLLEKST